MISMKVPISQTRKINIVAVRTYLQNSLIIHVCLASHGQYPISACICLKATLISKMQITSQGVSGLLGSTKVSIEDIGIDVYVAKYSIFFEHKEPSLDISSQDCFFPTGF